MKVALIDNDKAVTDMMTQELQSITGLELTAFNDTGAALDWCTQERVEIVLVDVTVADPGILDFISLLRQKKSEEDSLIAIMTEGGQGDLAQQAMDAGANDVVRMPLDSLELRVRVRNLMTFRKFHTDLIRANSELAMLATEDSLTGTWNRRYFLETSEMEFARAARFGNPLSVVMIDADYFKKVNDVYGHAAGDAVLRALADICKRDLRQIDLAGRIGGEEFAITLPDTPLDGCFTVAERCRSEMERKIIPFDDQELNVTISVGIAELQPEDASFAALMNRAGLALLRAKENGRNRIVYG